MKTIGFFYKSIVLLLLLLICPILLNAQTAFPWNGGTYTNLGSGSYSYVRTVGGVTMTATITNSNASYWKHSSPRYIASNIEPPDGSGTWCPSTYDVVPNGNQGLLLSTDWTTPVTQEINVSISFSHQVGFVRFKIYDINDNSSGQWKDKVQISGKNSAGTSLIITNELSCVNGGNAGNGSANGTVAGSGTTLLTYTGGGSSCTCWGNNNVLVGSGTNCSQVQRIDIKYTSASASNPSPQYIIISDLTINCIPLPIELSSFTGEAIDRSNLLSWETATEKHNSHFNLERSEDGIDWKTIATIQGAGTSMSPKSYSFLDTDFKNTVNYYRLQQVDFDGAEKSSDIVAIDNSLRIKTIAKIVNTLGQEVDESYRGMKIYLYTDGTIVKKME